MMLSSAVSLLLHYRGLPSLRRQPLLQTIYCLLDQQLNEATAQQAWGQSVSSLPLILPLFTISFCNRQPAGCWTSRTGAQIPAFSQEHRGVSYCQSTRDSHSCTRHWLPVWQRGRGCSLLRGTMKEQNPAPVVLGLQEEDILDTCPWQRPAAPDAQGLGTSGVLQRPGGWQQSPCSGALRCPVPSPRPGALVLCHLLARGPGCSPMSRPIPTAPAAAPSSPAACRPFPASRGCAAAVAEHSNRVFQVIFEELHDYWGAEIMEWINESLVGLSFKLKKKKRKSSLCHKCMI